MANTRYPAWWDWELELTPHAEKRMEERGLTEVELRALLHSATGVRRDHVEGRWIAEGRRRADTWGVILEPDEQLGVVVVVTAYRIG
jgi:hypothetical protein